MVQKYTPPVKKKKAGRFAFQLQLRSKVARKYIIDI